MQHDVHLQSRASFLLKWGIFQTFLLLFVCHGSAMAEPKPESSYWYSHDYPNPRTEPERCGRNAYHQSWLCDPDDFISEKDGKWRCMKKKLIRWLPSHLADVQQSKRMGYQTHLMLNSDDPSASSPSPLANGWILANWSCKPLQNAKPVLTDALTASASENSIDNDDSENSVVESCSDTDDDLIETDS